MILDRVEARLRDRRGSLLLEMSLAYVIMTMTIAAILPIYDLSIKASDRTQTTLKAAMLAQELMSEVKLRRWDQLSTRPGVPPSKGSAIGIDAGENAANKATFNDIDDFNGWSESPPQDPLGNAMPSMQGYVRTVSVDYLDASFAVTASTTAYKQVKVCVSKGSTTNICLFWLATNY